MVEVKNGINCMGRNLVTVASEIPLPGIYPEDTPSKILNNIHTVSHCDIIQNKIIDGKVEDFSWVNSKISIKLSTIKP